MATDIIGGIYSKGLGADRKGQTRQYTGTGVRLNTGGARSSVPLGTGRVNVGAGGSINTPKLHARMASPFLLDTPQAEGPIISEKAFAVGLTSLGRATEQYVDDTATLKARAKSLELNDAFFKIFHGNEETAGFRDTKGFEASDGYQDFSSKIDLAMKEALDGLDPLARQKAVMGMFASRNSYLNMGSNHAVSEKSKIDSGLRLAERSQIVSEATAFPPYLLDVPTKGEDGKLVSEPSVHKQRFFATYDIEDIARADNDWKSLVIQVAGGIYDKGKGRLQKDGSYSVGPGLEDVKQFRDTVGVSQLSADTLEVLDANIRAWEEKETADYVTTNRIKEANDKILANKKYRTNQGQLFSSYFDPTVETKPSVKAIWEMYEDDLIDRPTANAYTSLITSQSSGANKGTYDPVLYDELDKELTKEAKDLFISEEAGDSFVLKVSQSSLDDGSKKKLIDRRIRLKDSTAISERSRMEDMLDVLIPSKKDIFGRKTTFAAELTIKAFDAYDSFIADGSGYDAAYNKVVKMYDNEDTKFSALPPLGEFGKPKTQERLSSVLEAIEYKHKEGKIDETTYTLLTDYAQSYLDFFIRLSQQTNN